MATKRARPIKWAHGWPVAFVSLFFVFDFRLVPVRKDRHDDQRQPAAHGTISGTDSAPARRVEAREGGEVLEIALALCFLPGVQPCLG